MKTWALLALCLSCTLASPHVFADDLGERLQLLVRRAQYPESPATPGGRPSRREIRLTEAEVLNERARIETAGTAAALTDVETYLTHVSDLALTRIGAHLDVSPSWMESFTVRVPATYAELLGTTNPKVTIDRDLIRLNPLYIQGLELGALAKHPTSENFLTVMQFLATRSLLQNLVALRELQSYPTSTRPTIPAPLASKLRTLNITMTEISQIRQTAQDRLTRQAVVDSARELLAEFPLFFTESTAAALAEAVAGDDTLKREALKPLLLEVFSAAESQNTLTTIRNAAMHASLPVSLARVLTDAKTSCTMGKLTRLMLSPDPRLRSNGLNLNSEQRARILAVIATREAAYVHEISETLITHWSDSIQAITVEQTRERQRSQVIREMTLAARASADAIARAEIGETFDMNAAIRALLPEILALESGPELMNWAVEFGTAPSYVEARTRYAQIIIQLTSPNVVQYGLVLPERVELFISSHPFTPSSSLTRGLNREQARRQRLRTADLRIKRIRDLMQLGEWLGFHRSQWYGEHRLFPGGPQTVHQILRDEDREETYFEKLDEALLEKFPLLAINVFARLENGSLESVRLADGLAHLGTRSPEPLIEQALAQSELKIFEAIEKVGNAHRIEELQSILTSSVMLQELTRAHPEFENQALQAQERILDPSLTAQLLNRHFVHYAEVGFGALMLVHGARWVGTKLFGRTFPVLEILSAGAEPLMAGFMRSAAITLLARDAYAAAQLVQESENLDQSADLLTAGAVSTPLIGYSQIASMTQNYSTRKWTFFVQAAMDSPLFYMEGRTALREAGLLQTMRSPLDESELRLLEALR